MLIHVASTLHHFRQNALSSNPISCPWRAQCMHVRRAQSMYSQVHDDTIISQCLAPADQEKHEVSSKKRVGVDGLQGL